MSDQTDPAITARGHPGISKKLIHFRLHYTYNNT